MTTQAGPNRRWLLWLPLLLVSGWLASYGDNSPAGDAAVSLPVQPRAAAAPAQPTAGAEFNRPRTAAAEPTLALVPRDQLFGRVDDTPGAQHRVTRDLFSTRSWNPPAPAPAPQPAPAPVAPPVPYTFLGKKLEGDAWEVFLAKGNQTFVARANQVIESDWRVDRIAPPTLTLTYLPLGLPQSVAIGDSR